MIQQLKDSGYINKEMEEFFKFNVVHGRYLCGNIIQEFLPKIKETEIQVDDNLAIFTVSDLHSTNNSILKLVNLSKQINFLIVPKYVFWISKVEALYKHISENYSTLPDYILYLDGLDTLILKDIYNPKKYLDFYNCKVLFNVENQYAGTGYEAPTAEYLHNFYNDDYQNFLNKNREKYGNDLPFGLNAGVFLVEKKYVLKLLKEAYNYMKRNPNKGFPYGCTDDQYVFRYLHNKHYDLISVDIFNIFSFWGGQMSVDDNPNNYMFKIGYTDKYLRKYLDKKIENN